MKINSFRGELTDISAKKEPLTRTLTHHDFHLLAFTQRDEFREAEGHVEVLPQRSQLLQALFLCLPPSSCLRPVRLCTHSEHEERVVVGLGGGRLQAPQRGLQLNLPLFFPVLVHFV